MFGSILTQANISRGGLETVTPRLVAQAGCSSMATVHDECSVISRSRVHLAWKRRSKTRSILILGTTYGVQDEVRATMVPLWTRAINQIESRDISDLSSILPRFLFMGLLHHQQVMIDFVADDLFKHNAFRLVGKLGHSLSKAICLLWMRSGCKHRLTTHV